MQVEVVSTQTRTSSASATVDEKARVAWVDYAKGLCILFVVMMWCTLDYGHTVGEEGWLHHVVAFTRPFRMPDFFLLSGLFLAASIFSSSREYIDRKLIHFIYFYLLWLTIQLGLTESGLLISDPAGFARMFFTALIDPINSLWFVHMLAIFFMVTRWLRHVPKPLVFAAAIALQTAYHFGVIETGWSVADRFFDRYVYFFAGYAASPYIFDFARRVAQNASLAVPALLVWAVVNAIMTTLEIDQLPGTSLVLGFAGAAAVVAVGSLLTRHGWARWLAYAGKYSIVIYLTAFLPMKVLIKFFAGTQLVSDVGTVTALITLAAVVSPLLFHRIIRDTPLNFLYERPAAFRLSGDRDRLPPVTTTAPTPTAKAGKISTGR